MGDMKLKVKLGKGGNSLRITIPSEVIDLMGLKAGDIMELDVQDGILYVNKQEEK